MPGLKSQATQTQGKLHATQTLISHMSFCWSHPSLVLIEVAWRWCFGVPLLLLVWNQAQQILLGIPPESAGLDRLNFQNPWITSVLLADAAAIYHPAVVAVLRWLTPCAGVVWAVAAGLGRTALLVRLQKLDGVGVHRSASYLRRLAGMIALQGVWLAALLACFWLWYRGVAWAARTHITSAAEPDLVGYLCWLILLSLGWYTVWALLSWVFAIAPILFFCEADSIVPANVSLAASLAAWFAALSAGFDLGRGFSGKLVEANLVMAIVKIALIVLAMVFSAAPLPFSDQFGADFMHLLYILIAVAYLIANDYFQVVRLRSFVGFWRVYRGVEG